MAFFLRTPSNSEPSSALSSPTLRSAGSDTERELEAEDQLRTPTLPGALGMDGGSKLQNGHAQNGHAYEEPTTENGNGLLTPRSSDVVIEADAEARGRVRTKSEGHDGAAMGRGFRYPFGVDMRRVFDFVGGSRSPSLASVDMETNVFGSASPSSVSSASFAEGLSSDSESSGEITTAVESSRKATKADTTIATLTSMVGESTAITPGMYWGEDMEEEDEVPEDEEFKALKRKEKGKARAVDYEDILLPPHSGPSLATSKPEDTTFGNGDWTNMPSGKLEDQLDAPRRRHRTVVVTKEKISRRHHRRSSKDHFIQEREFSRDFLLVIALCVGLACAVMCLIRPTILFWMGEGYSMDPFLFDFDFD